jgi:putative ABC transport system ATP-binding protein
LSSGHNDDLHWRSVLSRKDRNRRGLAQIKRLEIGRKCIWRGCIDDRLEHFFSQVGTDPEEYLKVASDKITPPADESTGDLDSHSATEILEILKRLNEDFQKTVVMVTHDPHAASHAHVTRHLEKGMLLPPA